MENSTPGKRQLGQVVPSVLCTISLGSRAGVQGLRCQGIAIEGLGWGELERWRPWQGVEWILSYDPSIL